VIHVKMLSILSATRPLPFYLYLRGGLRQALRSSINYGPMRNQT